jgi:HlyD family secretion protein
MRKFVTRLILLAAVAGVAGMGYYIIHKMPEKKLEIPITQVKRGDLTLRTFVRGELQAVRSVVLSAPNLGASTQITDLAPPGALAQIKDLVVEFDDAELQTSLKEEELNVTQTEELLKKAEADQLIRRNQDQVDLLRARYAVRRAQLEVQRNELMSKIDARKNELTLEETKQALAKLEDDVKSRLQQGEAELAVLREQRRRAQLEVNRVRTRLAQTRVLSPISGLVSVKENRSGNFNFGQAAPEIREGDQINPGTPVAEILDLSEMNLMTRVNEIERANLHEGQEVLIQLDALAGKVVHGKIKTLSGTASSNVFSSDPTKRFDCFIAVDMKEVLGYVGASPQQIDRLMAVAAENAKRFASGAVTGSSSMLGGFGGPVGGPGGGFQAFGPGGGDNSPGAGDQPGGPDGAPGGGRGRPGGKTGGKAGGGGGAGRGLASMTPEERQKFVDQLAQGGGGGGGGRGGRGKGSGGPGGPQAPLPTLPGSPAGPAAEPDLSSLSLRQSIFQGFTADDREKAQLPQPPGEHSMTDVLLRPGLLGQAEIIVQKIPNVLYLPQQAIFEKNNQDVVFVRVGDRFEPRRVKLGGRTESQIAVLEGVKEGDTVALIDMEAGRNPQKKEKGSKSKSQGGGLPSPQARLERPAGLRERV